MTNPIKPPPLLGVTGATGFVGQHLIRQAIDLGYHVRAMARTPAKLGGLTHDKLDIFAAGLGEDDSAFVKGCDAVIHLAGLIKAPNRILSKVDHQEKSTPRKSISGKSTPGPNLIS